MGIKNWGFQLKRARRGLQNEKVCKIEKSKSLRKAERALAQALEQGQAHLGVEEETNIREMEGGVHSSTPDRGCSV